MALSKPHQLELPDDFPLEAFTRFHEASRTWLPHPSEPRREFNGACNLIGWRFRASSEYATAILDSWTRDGVDVSFEIKYARERDLYGMFSCGVAAFETTCYALNALLAVLSPPALPFDEKARRNSSAKRLCRQLEACLPNDPLTATLRDRLSSPEWKLWTDFRHTMTHRADIPRNIYGAFGAPVPKARLLAFTARWSHGALSGDQAEFRSILHWLAEAMRDIMVGGTTLADAA